MKGPIHELERPAGPPNGQALPPAARRRLSPDTPAPLWLKPTPPFRLDLTVWTLRRRPGNLIDRWDGASYRRVLVVGKKPIAVTVTQSGPLEQPRLKLELTGHRILPQEKAIIRRDLENSLGLKRDLKEFYALAARDPKLGPLVQQFRGVRPPRFPTLFEALANAIACQQMSLTLGILLLSRMAERFGRRAGRASAARAFPLPKDLAGLDPEDFRELGFSRQKGRSMIALAQAFSDGSFDGQTLDSLENPAAVERLVELRGIGRWSAEYALLRGLGRLDVYPGDDVGARNNLRRWLGLRRVLDYEGVRRITARWQPYAGLVYFHMLLDRLGATGALDASAAQGNPAPRPVIR